MKIIYENRKAYFNFEILEEFVAGIELLGPEIKSIRAGHVNLKGAYVSVVGGEAWLKGANINRYKYDSAKTYDPFRDRKLLMKKSEIEKLARHLGGKAATIAPLAIGLQGQWAKLKLAIVRGRKKEDKREVIKEREQKRTISRAIRTFRR